MVVNKFQKTLDSHQLQLTRGKTTTLQVNVGRLCNLACKHCHMDAGPGRREIMQRETMDAVIRFATEHSFSVIDITGGAPELVPDITSLLKQLAPLAQKTMLRTNLVDLLDTKGRKLLELCKQLKVTLVASFPSANKGQTDAQRGDGVWEQSLAMLHQLNSLGYGRPDTDLELNLVANPTGAFLPVDQCTAEKKFQADLARKWGIDFTHLFTFANVPLGRFKNWLESSGNLDSYIQKLTDGFNPTTIEGLMCRSQISVDWQGYLYDCDFNLAAGLPCTGKPIHLSNARLPAEGSQIMTDDYCFACTAGAGFT